jgi:sterol desaturase/sphingolipid hydroxylase (fatty acid hydroxylase superfamily)
MVPFIASSPIYWLYIVSALLLSIFIYRLRSAKQDKQTNIIKYLFPKEIYWHPSAIVEYKYYFLASLLDIFVLLPVISSLPNIADIIGNCLREITNVTAPFAIDIPHWYHRVMLSIFIALVGDFAQYCYHYLAHKITFFWEFHKVHHSAEVLTPMTVYRFHPIELCLLLIFYTTMLGIAMGIWAYLFGDRVSQISIYGVNCEIFLFYLTGYNLRHSHIWLKYPYKISHVLMSPAQHQIHHSIDPKHYDKNFGYILSMWDWIFGTLYVPRGYEKIDFGLANYESTLFNNTTNLLIQPLKILWQRYTKKRY